MEMLLLPQPEQNEETELNEDVDITKSATSSDSEGPIGVPPTRKKSLRKKKRQRAPDTSDEEEKYGDEKLEKEGNPLEMAEEDELPTEFQWRLAGSHTTFPWVKEKDPIENAGIIGISKKEFYKKTPFGLLQLFVPLTWFEEICDETNR